MNKEYYINIIKQNGIQKIDIVNNTSNFVEVVLAIDGKDIKHGQTVTQDTRGYCFPPGHQKAIEKTPDLKVLPFKRKGKVSAYIFQGKGEYKESDLEIPAFLRKKLGQKALFTRSKSESFQKLEVTY